MPELRAIVLIIAALVGLMPASARSEAAVMLKGNHPREAETLALVGEADPNQRLAMEIRFGPRPADLDAVSEWLKSEGFTVEPASEGSLKFSGTVAQAQRAWRKANLRATLS